MTGLAQYQPLFLLCLLLLPGFFILNAWRSELKKKKERLRIENALNIPSAPTEKKQRETLQIDAIPDSIILIVLGSLTLILLFANLTFYFIAAIDVGVFFCLRSISKMLRNVRLTQLTEALPSTIDFLARSIRSGDSFFAAIEQVAHANFPASAEFKPVYEALAVGKPFAETLKKAALKVNHPDFNLCMAVLIIQQETGKHDTKALNYLSTLLRNKIALRRKIKTSSAEARLSGYLIAFLPLLSFMILGLFSPSYLAPVFHTKLGQYLLISAACSNIVGLIVMKKMTQISI